jgi:hypothetical protein
VPATSLFEAASDVSCPGREELKRHNVACDRCLDASNSRASVTTLDAADADAAALDESVPPETELSSSSQQTTPPISRAASSRLQKSASLTAWPSQHILDAVQQAQMFADSKHFV